MDDSAQTTQQATTQPVSSTSDSAQHQSPPAVAAPTKEHAPVPVHTEFLKPAPHETAPEIAPEVAPHAEVTHNHEKPTISDEQRHVGIEESAAEKPAPTMLVDDQVFPLTPTQVADSQSKAYTVWDQFKWFGAVVGRQMQRAHKKLFR
jgi:hypothetical protein